MFDSLRPTQALQSFLFAAEQTSTSLFAADQISFAENLTENRDSRHFYIQKVLRVAQVDVTNWKHAAGLSAYGAFRHFAERNASLVVARACQPDAQYLGVGADASAVVRSQNFRRDHERIVRFASVGHYPFAVDVDVATAPHVDITQFKGVARSVLQGDRGH